MPWGLIGSWLTVVAGLFALFPWLDRHLRETPRATLARWLRGEVRADVNWARSFGDLYDRTFSTRTHYITIARSSYTLWIPSLWRSLVASTMAILGMTVLWISRLPDDVRIDIVNSRQSGRLIPYDLGVFKYDILDQTYFLDVMIIAPFVINFFGDFFSFLETRILINFVSKTRDRRLQASLIFIDLLLTTIIISCTFIAFAVFVFVISLTTNTNFQHFGLEDLFSLAVEVQTAMFESAYEYVVDPTAGLYGIFFYSTFLTSAWIWSLLFGGEVLRLLRSIPAVVSFTNRFFLINRYIDRHPLSVIGIVLLSISSVLIWGTYFIF